MNIEAKPTLADLIESFFRQRLVAQRRASPDTVSTYRDALRLFLIFGSQQKGKKPSQLSIEDLDRNLVLAFLDHLEKDRGNSVRTRNARLTAIRSFFQHVTYCNPTAMGIAQRILAIPGKKASIRVVKYLRKEELNAILKTPKLNTSQGRRDHALLTFLAHTGARVSEAIAVRSPDLRLQKPWQVLLRGKGGKERVIPIGREMAVLLNSLCKERGLEPDSMAPIFINTRGQRLTRHGVIYILRRAVTVATKTNPALAKHTISPHTLRHCCAMNLLQSGVDLTTIQSWLGHATVNTTHQYVEADLEMKRHALEKCDMPETKLARYKPDDQLLALLERL